MGWEAVVGEWGQHFIGGALVTTDYTQVLLYVWGILALCVMYPQYMQQISLSVPDSVARLIKVMAEQAGQSESDLLRQLVMPAVYEECSRRFKAINYLRHVEKMEKGE